MWGHGYKLIDPIDQESVETKAVEEALAQATSLIHQVLPGLRRTAQLHGLAHLVEKARDVAAQVLIINGVKRDQAVERLLNVNLAVLDQLVASMQFEAQLAREKIRSRVEVAEAAAPSIVVEGNTVRKVGSSSSQSHGPENWVADQEFYSDSFRMLADHAKCRANSVSMVQKTACIAMLLIEVLKSLIPLASLKFGA